VIPVFSEDCVELVKESEGLRLTRYFDPVGIPTIGYGHVVTDDDGDLMAITEEKADELLHWDILKAWNIVCRQVTVDLTQGQADALTDFVFNTGGGNLSRSTLLRLINQRKFNEASEQFERWVFAQDIKLPGLIVRREKERLLFIS